MPRLPGCACALCLCFVTVRSVTADSQWWRAEHVRSVYGSGQLGLPPLTTGLKHEPRF
jgi:hypothetical protein